MKKRFIIEKESTTNTSSYDDTTSSFQTDTISDEYYTENEGSFNGYPFLNIAKTKYRKPSNGTKQDLFTKDEIISRLENTIPLKSMEEKKILTKLPYFKTWVRYYNTKTKKFRIGGHLMKVVYPDYVVLVNLNNKISWTVQLKDCIFYITDPRLKQDDTNDTETNDIVNTSKKFNNYNIKKDSKDNMEDKIKDKLYTLYKQGKLSRLE
jgi:hypothetical protein